MQEPFVHLPHIGHGQHCARLRPRWPLSAPRWPKSGRDGGLISDGWKTPVAPVELGHLGAFAFVAATVVFFALTLAGAGLAVALYRSMLSGIDSTAAARVADVAADIETDGAGEVDARLLRTDERILTVQVIAADGLHIGIPEHASPFGRIRFSAQTVDAPDGRYTVLVGEGSQGISSTIKIVVAALAVAAPIVILVSAAATYLFVARSMRSVDAIRSRVADISASDLAERVPVPESRDEIAALAETMNEMLARIEAGHTARKCYGSGRGYGGAVPIASGQREPEVIDERVEKPCPIVRVADRPSADVHERQRTEEERDLNQRIRHGNRHAEQGAVAAAVACPRRKQFGGHQDEAKDQEEQGGHRRDDQDLAELGYGDDEHDVEPLGAAERAGSPGIRHRLKWCARQSH
jgi:HAMP domain-containing protein